MTLLLDKHYNKFGKPRWEYITVSDDRVFTADEVFSGEAKVIPTVISFVGHERDKESWNDTGFHYMIEVPVQLSLDSSVAEKQIGAVWNKLIEEMFHHCFVNISIEDVDDEYFSKEYELQFPELQQYENNEERRQMYIEHWNMAFDWRDLSAISLECSNDGDVSHKYSVNDVIYLTNDQILPDEVNYNCAIFGLDVHPKWEKRNHERIKAGEFFYPDSLVST